MNPRKGKARKVTEWATRAIERTSIADRRRRIAAMHLDRLTMTEIARRLGVALATVSKDLSIVRREWARESIEDLRAALVRELAALDRDEATLREEAARVAGKPREIARLYEAIARVQAMRHRLLGFTSPEILAMTIRVETAARPEPAARENLREYALQLCRTLRAQFGPDCAPDPEPLLARAEPANGTAAPPFEDLDRPAAPPTGREDG